MAQAYAGATPHVIHIVITHAMRPVPPSGKMPENSALSPSYNPGADLNLNRKPPAPKPLPPVRRGRTGYGGPSKPIPNVKYKPKSKPLANTKRVNGFNPEAQTRS